MRKISAKSNMPGARAVCALLFIVFTLLFPTTIHATAATDPLESASSIYKGLEPTLNIPIPNLKFSDITVSRGTEKTRTLDIPYLADYISAIYKYAVMIASALTAVMMMIGGFQYLTAGGDATRVSGAKKRIADALVGLALTLGIYLILFTFSPELVSMKGLQVSIVERIEFIANETTDFDELLAALPDDGKMGPNGVPILKQGRYASIPYINSNEPKCTTNPKSGKPYSVKSSGCGVSSAAMIISKYKGGDAQKNLVDLVQLVSETPDGRTCNSACTSCNGTAFGPMASAIEKKYGMKTSFTKDATTAVGKVKTGTPVIALVGPSIFTNGGHYIVLAGINADGTIAINDPYQSVYKTDWSKPKGSQALPEDIPMGRVPADMVLPYVKSFIVLEPK